MLTSAAELQATLAAGSPVTVLDVRWSLAGPPGRLDYEAGHIASAAFVDLDRDLSAPAGAGGRHPLPAASDFGEAMRRLGVRASVPVVIYDSGDSTSASRCWWLLEYFGHDQVSILDGGLAAWTAAGGSLEAGEQELRPPGDFEAVAGHLRLLDADGAAALAGNGILLDARPAPRYRGEVEPYDPVAGHIPGAVSAPTAENLGTDLRWRPPKELRERFAQLGIGASGEADISGHTPQPTTRAHAGAGPRAGVGVYCGSGVTAAHEVFALRLAGIDAALYVGSWSEWSQDASRPVAVGDEPG
ncbi:MAG: sulfurtransferase [Acidimicrobiales bacterium]|jgi:thiosulfate/3-mercaptopyruvate sulfurtransferase